MKTGYGIICYFYQIGLQIQKKYILWMKTSNVDLHGREISKMKGGYYSYFKKNGGWNQNRIIEWCILDMDMKKCHKLLLHHYGK